MKLRSEQTQGSKPWGAGHSFYMVWTLIGVCAVVVGICFVLGMVGTALWAILFAALIVFVLRSPVAWLSGKGVPRAVSTAIFVVLLIAVIVGIIFSFIPMIVSQAIALVQKLPEYISQVQDWWTALVAANPDFMQNEMVQGWISRLFEGLSGITSGIESGLVSNAISTGSAIGNVLFVAFTAFLVAFWVLIDYDKMAKEVHALAGRTAEWYLALFCTIISRVLKGYLKGTLIGALITAVIAGLGFWAFGLEFSLVMGVLVGLLSIVPYLGPFIATIVVGVISLFSGMTTFLACVVISLLVPWLVSTFVTPRIMSSTVNLHPGITMLVVLAGGAVGGMAGMVLAIPIAAIVKDIFVFFFEAITGRQLVDREGAIFNGEPSSKIDPVADATDNMLNEVMLKEIVDRNESDIHKIEDMPKRRISTLLADLARPVDSDSNGIADDSES